MTSLRSRLWLSYAVLILLVTAILGAGIAFSLANSPLLYRQTYTQLRNAQDLIIDRSEGFDKLSNLQQQKVLAQEAGNRSVRFILLTPEKQMIFDTGGVNRSSLRISRLNLSKYPDEDTQIGQVRDVRRRVWLFVATQLEDGRWLVTTAPRPGLVLVNILRDEVVRPMLIAVLFGLIISAAVAWGMAQSVTSPLKRLSDATKKLADGNYPVLPVDGPQEIQQVAETFNEMSQRVQNSQQTQRDFIANVSHELKTPLTSIQGFAQAILDGTAQTPEMLQHAAGVIFQETNRMYRLVLDLLTLSRLESGTADLQQLPVQLKPLLESIVDKFVLQAQAANITLSAQIPDLPVIIGDGDRLAQVFSNLVDNGIKFSPTGGAVSITAEVGKNDVMIHVADTGAGISAQEQQRIFERFYQADKSRRGGSDRGVGLGLAIARQIILSHAGEIRLKSEPGKGTVFTVCLPVPHGNDQK